MIWSCSSLCMGQLFESLNVTYFVCLKIAMFPALDDYKILFPFNKLNYEYLHYSRVHNRTLGVIKAV